MLRSIGEAEGWDCADFWRVDENATVLRPFERWSAPGIDAAFRLQGRPAEVSLRPGVGLAGSVWQSGEPLWIADATNDPRAMSALMPEETGLRAAVLFPVGHGGRVVGVLDFSSRAVRSLEPRFLETLET